MSKPKRIRGVGETCPECKRRPALSVWGTSLSNTWLECDFCDYSELSPPSPKNKP